jgi:hypothetical protein
MSFRGNEIFGKQAYFLPKINKNSGKVISHPCLQIVKERVLKSVSNLLKTSTTSLTIFSPVSFEAGVGSPSDAVLIPPGLLESLNLE